LLRYSAKRDLARLPDRLVRQRSGAKPPTLQAIGQALPSCVHVDGDDLIDEISARWRVGIELYATTAGQDTEHKHDGQYSMRRQTTK
jgi:hypothetical protein